MIKREITSGKRYEFQTHINDIIIPREEAESIEAFRVVIEPGKFTHSHLHNDTEQLYYIISGLGRGIYTDQSGESTEVSLKPGDVVYIPRNTRHQIFCSDKMEPLVYLCVDGFPLGKPAEESTWESHYQTVIAQQKAGG